MIIAANAISFAFAANVQRVDCNRSIHAEHSMSTVGRERLGRSVSSDRNIACICGPTHRSMGRSARAGDRR